MSQQQEMGRKVDEVADGMADVHESVGQVRRKDEEGGGHVRWDEEPCSASRLV